MDLNELQKLGTFRNAVGGGLIKSADYNKNFQDVKDVTNENVDILRQFQTEIQEDVAESLEISINGTAYKQAVAAGFEGTEEEFAELMASYGTVAKDVVETGTDVARMYQKFGDLITENALLYSVSVDGETICFESKISVIDDEDPDFDPHQDEDYVVNESLHLY